MRRVNVATAKKIAPRTNSVGNTKTMSGWMNVKIENGPSRSASNHGISDPTIIPNEHDDMTNIAVSRPPVKRPRR